MTKFRKGWRLLFIPLVILGFIVVGYGTMYLWNILMPDIFHLPLITFWQAIGLLVLARLLFGFGHHGGAGMAHHRRGRFLREKLMNMTPEEREQWKSRYHSCCTSDKYESSDVKE